MKKPAKKRAKPAAAPTPPEEKAVYDGSVPLDDPKQEFFCELFTTNTLPAFWGIGGKCYEFAYGYTDRIVELERQIAGTKKDRKGKSKVDCQREIDKIDATCRACASRLLTNANVKRRNGHLLDTLATNTIVDRELVYLIQQRQDNEMKFAAIQHHDKRTERIREKIDLKHQFEPINGINYTAPAPKT